MKIHVKQVDDRFHFRGTNEDGQTADMDNGPNGPSPMQLLIMAMGGCSGIDIVSILEKARQTIDTFDIDLDATREKKGTYSEFTAIHAHYTFTGDLDPAKVRRAVRLSVEKYCSVSKTLEHTAAITWSFSVNDTRYDG